MTATTTRHIDVIGETPGGDGFTQVARLRPQRRAHPDREDHLGAAGLAAGCCGSWPAATALSGRSTSPPARSTWSGSAMAPTGRSRTRSRSTSTAACTSPPTASSTGSWPAGTAFPGSPGRSGIRTASESKPGQVDDGTGTTPTVMPGGYVNITDNADPMDVVVYRTRVRLARRLHRMVCKVPVFKKGASADENSLIVAGRSMIVENNYGYSRSHGHRARRADRARLRAGRHQPQRQGLPRRLDEHHRSRPDRRLEAVARQRADLHLHQGSGRVGPLVLDRDQLPHRAHRLQAARRQPASATTTTTPASPSAAMAASTSGRSTGSSP